MGQHLAKWRRKKDARQTLYGLGENREHTLIIHYSCESFYDIKDGRTPRVTSIAVRRFANGSTESFSIHKSAELNGVAISDIESNYDDLERQMLGEFFSFLEKHSNYRFVHWNMRDINYGFQALEYRFKVLKGDPVKLHESQKFDLPRLLIDIFGPGYAPHGENGRLHSLLEMNAIKTKDILTGKGEADAFDNKEYVKLHQSTLKKVDVIDNLLDRFIEGRLKTKARWYEAYGWHPAVLIDLVKDHWLGSVVAFLIATVSLIAVFSPDLLPAIIKSISH
ncbi:hypothetical protein C0V73_22770 [Rhizobium sp. TH135]|uniref:hypothetical protein n=1 Tax=Rhizobium sp. TH135 TaxID=2067451 RepID=UPI000C7DE288|nr:hypothetical protein [Rhizobium sp. TH135]PLK68696.1 hypothetical protein C0V73_22770 [Rhizobium sp. TH135]